MSRPSDARTLEDNAEWLYDGWRYKKPRTPHRQFRFLYRIYDPKAAFWKVPPGDPGSVGRLFSSPVYDRGAMTLQVLRERVGDKAFFTILRTWTAEHAHGNATTADFVELAGRVSGRDLGPFFDRWLFTAGKPKLR